MARAWQSSRPRLRGFQWTSSLLWIPATLAAAAAQTARNATQRRLTETHRHRRRDPGPVPLRLSLRARFPRARHMRSPGRDDSRPNAVLPTSSSGRRGGPDPCHRAHAGRHAGALVLRRHGHHQDRAGADRGVRPCAPRRPADARGRGRDRHRDARRRARCRSKPGAGLASSGLRPVVLGLAAGAVLCARGDRLPRRDPGPRSEGPS